MRNLIRVICAAAILCLCMGAPPAAAAEQSTLTVWNTDANPKVLEALNELARKYERLDPKVSVRVVDVPLDKHEAKFEQALLDGTAPDIIRTESTLITRWAYRGYIRSLAPHLPEGFEKDFSEQTLSPLTLGKELFAAPQVAESPALLYNKKMLADAGQKPPRTWEEFRKVCEAMGKGKGSSLMIERPGTGAIFGLPWILSAGGDLFDPRTREIKIAGPESEVGVREFKRAWQDPCNRQHRTAINAYRDTISDMSFGEAAMTIGGPSAAGAMLGFSGLPDVNALGVMPVPAGPKGSIAPTLTRVYAMSRSTQSPVGAGKLIDFLTSTPAQVQLAEEVGLPPARASAAADSRVRGNPVVSGFQQALAQSRPLQNNPRTKLLLDPLTDTLASAVSGEDTVPQALNFFAEEMRRTALPRYGIEGNAAVRPVNNLVIALKPIAPFVTQSDAGWKGFSVDLIAAIADRNGWEPKYVEKATVPEALEAVAADEVDMAVGALSITPTRETLYDFSQGFFDGGLGIMVGPASQSADLVQALKQTFGTGEVGRWALIMLGLIAVGAHVLWFVRRRNDESGMPRSYVKGVGEGLWEAGISFTSGGYGSDEPRSPLARLFAFGWVMLSLVCISILTGILTSNLTAIKARSTIEGPDDLQGRTVTTVAGTTSAAWAADRPGIDWRITQKLEDSLALLQKGEVDAVVFDSPVLIYQAGQLGQGLTVAGQPFQRERYGIAFPINSPYRKDTNEAILELYTNGKWQEFYDKWFPAGN